VTTSTRAPALANVPSMAECLPNYEASIYVGIVAPRNAPADIVDKLNQALNLALADPKMKQRIAELADTPLSLSVANFSKPIAAETEKWEKVIRVTNIKPE
jgi:tripartite-type tricarboxylate transporter receptor subunit TctC